MYAYLLGQEIERILLREVISKWQYDITGRPTHHRVSSQSRNTRRRVYNWDVNHQLRSMVNELTGVKVTYGYDEFSNLVWANQDSKFDFLYRSVDDVGNLYEAKDKKDRVYGAGGRLLATQDAEFSYDEEGNLIEKVENNGDTWKYEYYGNGMMSKVIKPDNTEVTFKYDSLGRRIEKISEIDPIGLAGGNPTLYGYVSDLNAMIDPFGLIVRQPIIFLSTGGGVIHPKTISPNNPHGIFTIDATRSYFDDRAALAKEAGINDPGKNYRSHHIDYDPKTNTMRMQFVHEEYHKYPHVGGADDFKKDTGFKYGSPEAVAEATKRRNKLKGGCVT
ncbi:RHS repeat domain-containing protein [Lysinibacillus capsici]|uniref:RHS repeat domain-containing protein n=1 Tax=Lysinibacillus capsici TaxID=2115968 RepID=UPI001B51391F